MQDEAHYCFGANLQRIRKSRGLTQTALGINAGIPQNRISNWELRYHEPSLKDLRKLCMALNCDPSELLSLSTPELSSAEREILRAIRKLDENGLYVLKTTLQVQLQIGSKANEQNLT